MKELCGTPWPGRQSGTPGAGRQEQRGVRWSEGLLKGADRHGLTLRSTEAVPLHLIRPRLAYTHGVSNGSRMGHLGAPLRAEPSRFLSWAISAPGLPAMWGRRAQREVPDSGTAAGLFGGRSRIRTYDFHRVKVASYQPEADFKGVNSRPGGEKPVESAHFATNLLPNFAQWALG